MTPAGGNPDSVFSWGRAFLWGGSAALVGAACYWSVLELTGYEVGLLALGVGLLIGLGVRLGSSGRGGLLVQLLAMALTYLAIVVTYVPDVAAELQRKVPAAREVDGEAKDPPSVVERPRRTVAIAAEGEGPVRAAGLFVGLVLSVPLLAMGAGDHTGWIFLALGMIQAAILNRKDSRPTRKQTASRRRRGRRRTP